MTWKLLRCLLLVLAVGAARGEAWAKNWNLDKQENEKHALASFSDVRLCMFATDRGNWEQRLSHEKYVREAKRRDLSCGVDEAEFVQKSNKEICELATYPSGDNYKWSPLPRNKNHVKEAKKRGLDCTNPLTTVFISDLDDNVICSKATREGFWDNRNFFRKYVIEAKKRGLGCGVKEIVSLSDKEICEEATFDGRWAVTEFLYFHVQEAKRRGLSCGVNGAADTQIASSKVSSETDTLSAQPDQFICERATSTDGSKKHWTAGVWKVTGTYWPSRQYVQEAKRRGLSCGVGEANSTQISSSAESSDLNIKPLSNLPVCKAWEMGLNAWQKIGVAGLKGVRNCFGIYNILGIGEYVGEFKDGLYHGYGTHTSFATGEVETGIWEKDQFKKAQKMPSSGASATQTAASTNTQPNTPTSAALTAVEKEAERLRQRVAALEAKQQKQQQTIANDTQVPLITITQSGADGRKGSVKGYAKDNVQVAEVLIDGQAVRVGNDGSFEWSGFVPATGKEITIEAIDTAALSSTQVISLKRGQIQQASGPRFDVLDPTAGKKVKRNDNALALIVGISDYKRTDAPAVYADKDAQYFHDYASLKLGISDSNIKTMVNAKAEQGDVILAVKDWMRRASKPGKTDVYVFFAGHGLASDDGEQMYLLPYDGRPRLLDDTAILRDRLFSDIASANPRSVTVFLDTCYSGTTRGTDMLIASRPIAIKALQQSVPDNFTVMTAAAGDQTAKPLEEAKHGMFSYFLMKGMEGDADSNQDNKITAGELHQYVQQNVVQQSSGSQTPELQGDAERVLVRFQ